MISLKTNWIKYFIVLSENKSFSSAARKLGISVSALSQNISNLENYLDFKLIERNTKNIELTDKGRMFLEKSFNFINELSNIEFLIKENNLSKESIKIGWANFWGSYILPDMIEKTFNKFSDFYPQIYGFSIEESKSLILNNKIDFAIITGQVNNDLKIDISDKNICYLAGEKIKILEVCSNNKENINISSLSQINIENEFNIEVATLSNLITVSDKLDLSLKLPEIIFKNIKWKNKKNIKIIETENYIIPYLIWNKNLLITDIKTFFIETFKLVSKESLN